MHRESYQDNYWTWNIWKNHLQTNLHVYLGPLLPGELWREGQVLEASAPRKVWQEIPDVRAELLCDALLLMTQSFTPKYSSWPGGERGFTIWGKAYTFYTWNEANYENKIEQGIWWFLGVFNLLNFILHYFLLFGWINFRAVPQQG